MQLIVTIPEEIVARVKSKLPPSEMGVLEAVALDAVLGFLSKLENAPEKSRPK